MKRLTQSDWRLLDALLAYAAAGGPEDVGLDVDCDPDDFAQRVERLHTKVSERLR